MAGDRRLRKTSQVIDTSKGQTPAPKVVFAPKGKWRTSMTTRDQLDRLSSTGYMPPPKTTFAHLGLTSVNNTIVHATIPHPAENEWVCFVPSLVGGPEL